ncbi:hypothetical protein ACFSUI_05655 [Ralstonia solanacearum]
MTGIGASDWSDGATATLCQSIHQLTSEARRNVDRGKADGAVDRFNGLLQQGQRLLNWYGYVFQRNWQAFATPFNAVAGDVSAKSDALAQYRAALTSPAWLGAKRLQLARGQWQNPEWELFHHYVKLLALGDSVGSIDTLIGTMGQQLSIPSTVAAGPGRPTGSGCSGRSKGCACRSAMTISTAPREAASCVPPRSCRPRRPGVSAFRSPSRRGTRRISCRTAMAAAIGTIRPAVAFVPARRC